MPKAWNCCICNKAVYEDGFDPCAVLLVTNIESPRSEQREQTFFCHIECFRQLPGVQGAMYITEPDFATIGELEEEYGPYETWDLDDTEQDQNAGAG
jgi:hypothetical protein